MRDANTFFDNFTPGHGFFQTFAISKYLGDNRSGIINQS
jgi:hypothetical protein